MVNSFENLGIKDFSAYFNPQKQVDFFEELELGLISPEIFYDKFREATNSQLTDEIIEENWNLILKDFQKERMDLLTELSADFSLYLFQIRMLFTLSVLSNVVLKKWVSLYQLILEKLIIHMTCI